MKSVVHRLEWLVESLGGLARLCILALVLLVATNVILRYLFSIGPVALQELEWHLVSPIALLGLSYSMKHRADVRIDFLYERFPARLCAASDLIAALLTVAVGAIIAWLSLAYVNQAYNLNEGSPDPGGLPMRYLLKAFIPLGFLLLVIQGIADSLRAIARIHDPATDLAPENKLSTETSA
ncbi:C4-dicarboxylate ABC transporter permease [Marinobacter nanhaiticus D15-8W]|uniref:TRAP transporter small permease protein n=1 Tax=Marinobacter nanhaiticus D15-8W TaxID=626887 RepID=N6X482_9GAMM|nr:TRAP transporter small permease subunit [Marinobacter nanhaiticus]ENO15893.1 C4-dicarboxylate ABC transporter permease [Marinobacter nanhaiticus D15-8W]